MAEKEPVASVAWVEVLSLLTTRIFRASFWPCTHLASTTHYKRTRTARRERRHVVLVARVVVVVTTQEASFCLAGQSRWIRLMRMRSVCMYVEGAQKSFYVKWTVRYQ